MRVSEEHGRQERKHSPLPARVPPTSRLALLLLVAPLAFKNSQALCSRKGIVFRGTEYCPPTRPLSQHFALSEK